MKGEIRLCMTVAKDNLGHQRVCHADVGNIAAVQLDFGNPA